MGIFKDLNNATQLGRDARASYDGKATRAAGMERMAAANAAMAAQAAAMAPVTDGVVCQAQVLSAGPATGMVNSNPLIPLELLVTQPGLPPRPVTTTQLVPVTQVARLAVGASVAVRVSAADPTAVALVWDTTA